RLCRAKSMFAPSIKSYSRSIRGESCKWFWSCRGSSAALATSRPSWKNCSNLFNLFPLADQGLVALGGEDSLEVRARRSRRTDKEFRFSRSLLRQAIREGAAILSADLRGDERFAGVFSLLNSDARSVMCVPLFGYENNPLGVVHLTSCRPDSPFHQEDLD